VPVRRWWKHAPPPTVLIVLVVIALAVVPAVATHRSAAGRYQAAAPTCGVARWPVKTLADGAAASIDSKPTAATVLGLSTLPAPAHIGDKLARQTGFAGAEFKTHKLTVRLVAWKLSDNDSDIHLEVRGRFAPQTMVVEFRSRAVSPRARTRPSGRRWPPPRPPSSLPAATRIHRRRRCASCRARRRSPASASSRKLFKRVWMSGRPDPPAVDLRVWDVQPGLSQAATNEWVEGQTLITNAYEWCLDMPAQLQLAVSA
jgi:hypothetical protein